MAREARQRSALTTALVVLRVVMILAGVVLLGKWIVDSIGGYIHVSYVLAAFGLFIAAFCVSYLE